MANPKGVVDTITSTVGQARITEFQIVGLFGGAEQLSVPFPDPAESHSSPGILIISGRNGTGKTTIPRMIDGMLRLDFDTFRSIPFSHAKLSLSSGDTLRIEWNGVNSDFPLFASFGTHRVALAKSRKDASYSSTQEQAIEAFREAALPILGSINYVLLEVGRFPSRHRRGNRPFLDPDTGELVPPNAGPPPLVDQVRNFLRDAQVDYRIFFRSEELEVLPRLLSRLQLDRATPSRPSLLARVRAIRAKSSTMARFGLQMDEDALTSLENIIANPVYNGPGQISLIETYVESQEAVQKARDLIATRLTEFEEIMDDFLIDKVVRIDARRGLAISTRTTPLTELELSTGEFHFLYMMVSALLCRRTGSVIAIDEPELSLYVSWQRKLVNALARCAAGASPLFLFATHSLAIQAEHSNRVVNLSAID